MTAISSERQDLAIGLVGGATAVLDLHRTRLLTDPTFSPVGAYGPLTRTEPAALSGEELGPADVVLLSHDQHADNFDPAGREYAATAGRIFTTPGGEARLGGTAVGLAPWSRTAVALAGGGELTVEAAPAVHGPLDGRRDASGSVNCEVTGWVLSGEGLPTIYVSGDNASVGAVAAVAARHPHIDVAVLFCGAARVPYRDQGRPLTLTSERAADATVLLGKPWIVPVQYQGWAHFSEDLNRLIEAFEDAGVRSRLLLADPGTWSLEGLPERSPG
jgi:L-ascorbate metabolism protein UlaG (beta-lactamase superfamily)